LLDANIDRLKKLAHDAGELYKNGFAEKLDIDKINVQLANLETEKTKALNSISIGYLGLKTLMGMPVKDTLVLADQISEAQIKDDFSNDTAYQYADRKDFQSLSLARKLNEFNIKRYQLSYLPTLSLNASYSKNAQRNSFSFFGKGDWFTTSFIGLNLAIPIFDGFAKDARIKKSRLELRQVDNQMDNLKISIDGEVEQAKLNFRSSLATMDYQKKNMQLAENVYDQTKKKFEIGTGSNTEITSAQTDLVTAQTNYINALYTAIIARVDYLKATGKL
jgi:outer membrane protein TolC